MKQTRIASIVLIFLSRATCDYDSYYSDSGEFDFDPYSLYDQKVWRLNLKGTLRERMMFNIATADTGKSFVCSPISALFPMGKLVLGASDSCKQQLNQVIGVNSKLELQSSFRSLLRDLQLLTGVTMSICSRIYISKEYSLNPLFENDAKEIFKSSVKRVDLSKSEKVAGKINKWVNGRTRGMIPEIIKPSDISSSSSLILVNAVYFSGAWEDRFKTVSIQDFYTAKSTRKVSMMSRDGKYKYTKSDALDSQIIEIPYTGGQASFVIFLPNKHDGLPVLLYKLKLAPELMQIALDQMKTEHVQLSMPKFKTTTDLNLTDAYMKLGLLSIFQPHVPCLEKIVRNEKSLYVSKAIQKAIIEVDEYGTKAAAVTVVEITLLSLVLNKVIFNANRPFYYFIKVKKEIIFSVVQILGVSLQVPSIKFIANSPFMYFVKVKKEVIFAGTFV